MSKNKYILQYGSLAGWPYLVAQGLREAGYNSINVIAENSDVHDLDRQLSHDRALSKKSSSKLKKFLDRTSFVLEAAENASLVHYHGAVIQRSQWFPLFEGPLFRKKNIPMLMSFGGGDARIISDARACNPYFYRDADEKRDARTRNYLKSISKYIRYVATDCEMSRYAQPYFERCFVFRQPVDLRLIKFVPSTVDRPPIFLHAPTEPWVKGTEQIVAAAELLRGQGYKFEFRLRRQMTQSQFFEELMNCDVYIDELRCGSHGVTAVEAMAAGKPTMTYVRPDLVSEYPVELPLINTNPDTIFEQMKLLICDQDRRIATSYASRNYVEKYHDVNVVVRELLGIYNEIGL